MSTTIAMTAAIVDSYQPAVVDAPIVQTFVAPATPYGPGHRGVEYATRPGQVVVAEADGQVTFAGQVAGRLHVVVAHADGVRTSYSYLSAIAVVAGERVSGGQVIGTAGPLLHVGARVGDAYIDPLSLLPQEGGAVHVRLVPDEAGEPAEWGRSARTTTVSTP
jgi:murein DD-endopeptidase MepM/ murein hydrolase activator NlpD